MNRLERWIYERVKNRPLLKQRIVDLYQATMALVPQAPLKTAFEAVVRPGYFFGFHDKTPFSPDGRLLLAHRNLIGDRIVTCGDEVEVGFFSDAKWAQYHPLARTTGWNWQLGSMLQWLGVSGEAVVYNAVQAGHPVANVANLDGTTLDQWPVPVVHVSPDGVNACSYDFFRVERGLPGYGIVPDRPVREDDPNGRFSVFACGSGVTTFSMTLSDAAAIAHQPSMDRAFHFFHHALFSPDSRRLFFLHRWIDVNQRLWTRMFSVTPDGGDLFLFPMNEMVSHVTWASSTEVFGYLRHPEQGDGYYLMEDLTGRSTPFFEGMLNSDGHPTMDKDRGIVVTDTYPDRFRNQRLLLGMLTGKAMIELCRTHLSRHFMRELQVDLHPRLHPLENVVCFDSGHTGTRALVTMDFSAAM